MLGNGPVRFGGRPHGKGPAQRAPRRAAHPVPSVTSILGHDLLSGIFRPLGLAFLLLHVGQLLYLVRLCAHAGSVAACCLSIVELGLGSRGGCLLGRRNLGLFFVLGRFGRILALDSHVVGLLLRGAVRFSAACAAARFRCSAAVRASLT